MVRFAHIADVAKWFCEAVKRPIADFRSALIQAPQGEWGLLALDVDVVVMYATCL
jgi:hypothetical protein